MLLLITLIPLLSAIAIIPYKRSRLSVLIAAGAVALTLLLLLLTPAGTAINLAGLHFYLQAPARLFTGTALAVSLIALVALFDHPPVSSTIPATLITVGLMIAALFLLEQPLIFANLLTIAGLTGLMAAGRNSQAMTTAGRSSVIVIMGAWLALVAGYIWGGITRQEPAPSLLMQLAAAALVLGFAVRSGALPFAFWLPRLAEVVCPITLTPLILLDLAALAGFIMTQPVFPKLLVAPQMVTAIMVTGLITAIIPALLALGTHNLHRLIIFAALNDLGYLLAGAGSATVLGLTGTLFGMVNHAFAFILLAICTVEIARHEDEQPEAAMLLPVAGAVFALLAFVGFPLLSGFTGRWMIYQAIAQKSTWLLTGLLLATALSVLAYLRVFYTLFLRSQHARFTVYRRPQLSGILIIILVALLLVTGLFPAPLVERIGNIVQKYSFLQLL